MTKQPMRDIAGPERRSIRDIHRSDISDVRRRPHEEYAPVHTGDNEGYNIPPQPPHSPRGGDEAPRHSRMTLWLIAAGSVVLVLVLLSTLFAGATARIVPTQATVALDNSFTASRDASKTGITFKLVAVNDEASQDVPATDERFVERKASGTIVVYNAYSSRDQRLITNTRFETPDGKIYRIASPIVVPGTRVEKGEIVPGSIEATVYADAPGTDYNIGLSDFTIPGFKGDPRYQKFYARSKTPMTGGSSGTVHVASDDDVKAARATLQQTLEESLYQNALSQVPDDYILFKDATFFSSTGPEGPYETDGDAVHVTEKGTLYAVIFNKSELSKQVALDNLQTYDGSDVLIRDLADLKFSIPQKQTVDPVNDQDITFILTGTAHFVWQVDTDALKRDLAGIKKDAFGGVVEQYKSIKRAEATVRPFWSSAFPENPNDITIDIQLDQ